MPNCLSFIARSSWYGETKPPIELNHHQGTTHRAPARRNSLFTGFFASAVTSARTVKSVLTARASFTIVSNDARQILRPRWGHR